MAEIILAAVIKKSVEIAGNILVQGGLRLYWLKDDIDWLQREAGHLQSYLAYATAKVVEGDSRVKNLIKDIEELAGDVEDILDELLSKMASHNSRGTIGCLKEIACILCHTRFSHKFAMEIEKIKRRVAEIDRVRTTYGITDTGNNNNDHDYIPFDHRRLFLHAEETEVIGFDDDFNMLQLKLLDQDSRYGVISIVGMPGLGKTTLAKKLYRYVCNQFECSALVYVSQQPRVGEILLDIAKQVGLNEEERKDNLEDNLRTILKRKRYVILLDDIWNVEIWDDLKLVLYECNSKIGSKVIITSRNSDVGRYIGGNSSLHVLEPLVSEKSIELFTKRIFTFDNSCWVNAPPNLENIGREIVERCGGIPLAIVLIAGMLRARERTVYAWNRVLETMSQNIQDQCAKILALSYNDLPTALRPCFLYFGLFPEDHEILAFDLINIWVAEKFIVVNNDYMREVEDIAEDFLNDLVSRNLIQVSRRTFEGRIGSCRIHDLLHSLCVSLARESNFFTTKDNASGDPRVVSRLRRFAYYSGGVDELFYLKPKPKKLRALLCFTSAISLETHIDFKLLRVLSIRNPFQTVTIPEGIGNLSCLSYLKLWGKNFKGNMPRSIVKLNHLLTLDIQWTNVRVAFDVMELKQMRHLRLSKLLDCPFFTSGSVSSINVLLPNLQTLIWMDDYYIKARWLHQLTNLRKLALTANNKFITEVFSTPLAILPKLEVLKLRTHHTLLDNYLHREQINLSSYDNLLKLRLNSTELRIVNFDALPVNLVKLCLYFVELEMYHITMLKRLPKLMILKFERCWLERDESKMDLSGADSFPQLEVLHILGWKSWEVIVDELAMPNLKKVIVSDLGAAKIRLSERLARLRI